MEKKIICKRTKLSPWRIFNRSNGSIALRNANSPKKDNVMGGRWWNLVSGEVRMLRNSCVVKAAAEMLQGFRKIRICWEFLTTNRIKKHVVKPAREDPVTELLYGKLLKLGSACVVPILWYSNDSTPQETRGLSSLQHSEIASTLRRELDTAASQTLLGKLLLLEVLTSTPAQIRVTPGSLSPVGPSYPTAWKPKENPVQGRKHKELAFFSAIC